eukprot:gene17188-biopygen20350
MDGMELYVASPPRFGRSCTVRVPLPRRDRDCEGRSHTNVCRVAQRKMELYGYAQRRTESHGDIRRRSTARGNARSHTEPGVALSRAVSPCIAQSRPKSSG